MIICKVRMLINEGSQTKHLWYPHTEWRICRWIKWLLLTWSHFPFPFLHILGHCQSTGKYWTFSIYTYGEGWTQSITMLPTLVTNDPPTSASPVGDMHHDAQLHLTFKHYLTKVITSNSLINFFKMVSKILSLPSFILTLVFFADSSSPSL